MLSLKSLVEGRISRVTRVVIIFVDADDNGDHFNYYWSFRLFTFICVVVET